MFCGELNTVIFKIAFGTAVDKMVLSTIPDNYCCIRNQGDFCVVSCIEYGSSHSLGGNVTNKVQRNARRSDGGGDVYRKGVKSPPSMVRGYLCPRPLGKWKDRWRWAREGLG